MVTACVISYEFFANVLRQMQLARFIGAPKFMTFKRTDPTMGAYLSEFGVSREEAEARMAVGGGAPDEFVSFSARRVHRFSKMGNPWLWLVYTVSWHA